MSNLNVELLAPSIGVNELWEQFKMLSKFVDRFWPTLYTGATRLGLHIPKDYYAPERISINKQDREGRETSGETRLHYHIGLKYAAGHKYNSDTAPSEEQLIETVKDINMLLEAASKDIKSKIIITFLEMKADNIE